MIQAAGKSFKLGFYACQTGIWNASWASWKACTGWKGRRLGQVKPELGQMCGKWPLQKLGNLVFQGKAD
jgi:hypothetical protein